MPAITTRVHRASIASACLAFAAATARADTLESALALVPADAGGAFVVPSLKKCSDELMTCLERVDRAEALLVGRPLDLLKARLGVVGGVRDDGALVGVLRWPEGASSPMATLLVPVNDAKAFLEGNFPLDPAGNGMRTGAGGQKLASKVIETKGRGAWVALADVPAGVEGIAEDGAVVAKHLDRLGPKREGLLKRADILAWLDGPFVRALAKSSGAGGVTVAGSPIDAQELKRIEARLAPFRDGLTVAAIAWDVDALGLLGRGLLRFDPASDAGRLFAGGDETAPELVKSRATAGLARLPDNPFYWAVGIDLLGLGGAPTLAGLDAFLPGAKDAGAWLADVRDVAWGVYPSKLGVAVGGMLNDSALVLGHGDPSKLRNELHARLDALAGERDGVRRAVKWTADREVKSKEFAETLVADAYELVETPLPGAPPAPDAATQALVRSTLFGQRGVHGFVKPVEGALVITSSQRPDVLRRAIDSAPGTNARRLSMNATIASMGEFLLPNPDIEAFLGLTAIGKLVRQTLATFGVAAGDQPDFDFGAEPVGLALEVDQHDVEGAIVIPAAVVGVAVDMAKRQRGG